MINCQGRPIRSALGELAARPLGGVVVEDGVFPAAVRAA
jgi:hypothetical protein